jgi:hypothetical protein
MSPKLGGTIHSLVDLKSQKLELQTRKKHKDNNKKELGEGGGVAKVRSYILAIEKPKKKKLFKVFSKRYQSVNQLLDAIKN